jgi:hypothetical protein
MLRLLVYGSKSWENRAGSVAGTVAGLFVPLGALVQLVGERRSVDSRETAVGRWA